MKTFKKVKRLIQFSKTMFLCVLKPEEVQDALKNSYENIKLLFEEENENSIKI